MTTATRKDKTDKMMDLRGCAADAQSENMQIASGRNENLVRVLLTIRMTDIFFTQCIFHQFT